MAVLKQNCSYLARIARSLLRLHIVWCVAVTAMLPPRANAAPDAETQIKAAFILNFARFVEWPATGSSNTNEPFVIGVLGRDPFGTAADVIFSGKTINDRPIKLLNLSSDEQIETCQVLFVAESEKARLPAVLKMVEGRTILTVSDIPGFVDAGGMFGLKRKQNMMRFDINMRSASSSKLKISSKLFKLADNVADNR